jgi:tetratricopeptide (TPR) repeat protein
MAGILETLGVDSSLPEIEEIVEETPESILDIDPREQELELMASEAEERKAPSPERVRIWLELSLLHRRLADSEDSQRKARLKQSEMVARKAIEVAAQAKDTFGYLCSMDALADALAAQNKYAQSEKILEAAIKMEASLPHPDSFRTAQRLHLIGVLRQRAGNAKDAIPVLEKALKLHEDSIGTDNDRTILVLLRLGGAHRAKGTHKAAQKCLKYALRYLQSTRKSILDQDAVECLFQLTGSYEESNNMEAAATEYERLLTLLDLELGRKLDEIGEMQYSVAAMYIRWGNYGRARELLAFALGTFRPAGGPRLAVGYETLANVEEASGHYPDAVRELANAAKVWTKCGNRNAELAANMNYRAELLDLLRRSKDAEWLRDQAAELGFPAKGRTEAKPKPEIRLTPDVMVPEVKAPAENTHRLELVRRAV